MPSPLAALSPLDGRYASTVDPLREHFSERSLIRYRIRIELAWLEALAAERSIKEVKPFSTATTKAFSRLGKEMANFAQRLAWLLARIAEVAVLVKVIVAVGNYNAHLAAYPGFAWERFCRRFVERLGLPLRVDLQFNAYTTQIEPHDWIAEL